MIDFDSVLKDLSARAEGKGHDSLATEERFMREANRMASSGYRFEKGSLEALWSYLDGYSIGLVGSIGSGKTMFFRLLETVQLDRFDIDPHINILPMGILASMTTHEIVERMDEMRMHEVLIDDIGSEQINNTFGVKSEILSLVLECRCESKHRTHFTTNLSGATIKERYGDRIIDRLKMFRTFVLNGRSNRVPTQNRFLSMMRERIV